MAQLLQNALYGTALILAAAALRLVLKGRLIPKARLALWAVCLFRLLTPAAPESVLSLWGLPRLFRPGQAPAAPAPVTGTPQFYELPQTASAPRPAPGIPWETVLLAVWLAVGLVLAVRYVLSWTRTRRAVSRATPVGRGDPRYALLPKCARLREGAMEGAPLTFGALRPTVVLPPGLSGEALDCVLAHEGAHARRRDNLWHYAMALALALYWWNPAVWLMARLLRRDIELSCDRAALKKLGAGRRADYANTLVTLATQGDGPAFCQTFGRKAAEERILSVMKFKKTSVIGVISSLVLVLAVTAAFASEPKEPEYDSVKVNTSVELGDRTPSDAAPVPSAGVDTQHDLHKVNPDDVDLSAMKEYLAKKVVNGEITQAEADQRLAAAEEMLERARRGEVELFLTDDGCFYGSNAGWMYYKDENGKLIPIDPDTAVTGYVLINYEVKLSEIDENGVSRVYDDEGNLIAVGEPRYSPEDAYGLYDLCKAKDCDVPYDHCHIDGKVVRVYYEYPGLLCAHPGCDNEQPHEHDGVQYAGKAGAFVVLPRNPGPLPSSDPVFVEDGDPVPVCSGPIETDYDYDHRPAPTLMSLEQYEALLDGLVSQGRMTREDADWFLDGATKGLKSPANRLYATEDGSYMIM